MKVLKWVAIAFGALLLLGLLVSLTSPEGREGLERGIDAASSEEPTPTAEPTLVAVATPNLTPTPDPTPEPTPVIVTETVEVEVVPEVCREALLAADRVIGMASEFPLDVLNAYVDYPDEDLVQFGRRVEDLMASYDVDAMDAEWATYTALADECLARP